MTTVRDATTDDVEDLIRIRIVMLEGVGHPPADLDWVPAATRELARQLAAGSMLGALAEVDGRVVSGAMARLFQQLPGDGGDDGSRAWIFSVATEPAYRRQGLARAVVTHLVQRLDALGVVRSELTATTDGEPMYRALGFTDSANPLLRRRRP